MKAKAVRRTAHTMAGDHASNPHASSESSDLVENRGVGEGEFRYPAFVATGPDGRVYVSDGMNFRIQAFGPQGDFLFQFGRHGDTPGSFARPKGLAVDSEGHVYVVDAAFNNVQIFDNEGRLLMAFAGIGGGDGTLWMPLGITIDPQDRIMVADRFNDRLQVYQYLSVPEPIPAASTPEVGDGKTDGRGSH